MKEKELRECAICAVCGKKICACGIPVFYRLTVARYGVNAKAIRRQAGLEMVLGGNAVLAQAMGPDEEMTTTLVEPNTITVCDACSTKPLMIAELAEVPF